MAKIKKLALYKVLAVIIFLIFISKEDISEHLRKLPNITLLVINRVKCRKQMPWLSDSGNNELP
jgi:hypothetical protein